ncbi:MAG TPA: hypothetical protein DIT07_05775 [Sphingobacteriaceae bacterium]|nr:hypothetical protein [Sphingobacteriaceae bacterium]
MKFLKVLLGIIIALVAIFFIVGMFLPKTYSLTRSIVINAPDSVIYNNIADMNNFKKWNPWLKKEPTAVVNVSGTAGQVGHFYTWKGEDNNTGQGQMTIVKVEPYKMVDEEIKFFKPMTGTGDVMFNLAPDAGGIKVDWMMSGENKSTVDKWMGLCMGLLMGKDFENGLKDLKAMSEKK